MLLATFVPQHAQADVEAGPAQSANALAVDDRIRVAATDVDPTDARLDDRVGAGTAASSVAARLERHRDRGTAQRCSTRPTHGTPQGNHLGMLTLRARRAPTQHAPVAKHHGTDARARKRPTLCPPSLLHREPHRGLG